MSNVLKGAENLWSNCANVVLSCFSEVALCWVAGQCGQKPIQVWSKSKYSCHPHSLRRQRFCTACNVNNGIKPVVVVVVNYYNVIDVL